MQDTGERLISEYHMNDLIYGEHIARYVLSAEIVEKKTVLDIASGTGYGTYMIAQKAKRVVGVDISKEAVEYAQKNYSLKNLEFKQGSVDNIPSKDASFDIVNSFETIEHVDTYEKFITEAKRVLKPNGLLIVSTPNKKEFIENNHYHVHEFTEQEFLKLLRPSFKNVKLYYQESFKGSSIHGPEDFSRTWQKKELVFKSLNQPKEKAIYFIALCSDYELPDYGSISVIAENWSDKDLAKKEAQAELRVRDYEHRVAELVGQNTTLLRSLTELKASKSWRLTKPFRKAKKVITSIKPTNN